MNIIDNINSLLGEDLKASIKAKAKIKIAASCFSIYAYEALKSELSKIESLEFIFTAPTFVPTEATDKIRKERREFFIPKAHREHSLYGSEFEIQLRNKLTQRAIARECAKCCIVVRSPSSARTEDASPSIVPVVAAKPTRTVCSGCGSWSMWSMNRTSTSITLNHHCVGGSIGPEFTTR